MMIRRNFVTTLAALVASPPVLAQRVPVIDVHLNPSWGCCGAWMDLLRANGFRVKPIATEDHGVIRRRHGVPDALGGCHTAVIEGYTIEGHVPAREIKRLLAERPQAKGLAVPGMPMDSPGMESTRRESFDVLLIQPSGRHTVYQKY